jgi:hypothetical protein
MVIGGYELGQILTTMINVKTFLDVIYAAIGETSATAFGNAPIMA